MDKNSLVLPDFPESLIPRIDHYGKRLHEANPGARFTRTDCVKALLVRALAETEGQEIWERRGGRGRGEALRGPDRRRELRRTRDRAIQHIEKEIGEILQIDW